jgi:hypothetical protein
VRAADSLKSRRTVAFAAVFLVCRIEAVDDD